MILFCLKEDDFVQKGMVLGLRHGSNASNNLGSVIVVEYVLKPHRVSKRIKFLRHTFPCQ